MCKAPKPPEPKEPDKPEYLRNAYLDAAVGQSGVVDQLRQGRSGFRIDLDSSLAVGSRTPGTSLVPQTPETPTSFSDVIRPTPRGGVEGISRRGQGGRRVEQR